VGGQASKIIKVDARGRVTDFAISEKCAAGSGRFLQVIARVLGVNLEDIGPLSLKSSDGVKFSTSCAVFAESEAISRITEGARKEDILAGVPPTTCPTGSSTRCSTARHRSSRRSRRRLGSC
jgi:activator of 2-hydroxyglutaryl-CoA dehydratase